MNLDKNKNIAVAYIPVLHKGYFDFLNILEEKKVQKLYIIGDSILETNEELDYLNRKDRLRALSTEVVVKTLKAVVTFEVEVLELDFIDDIERSGCKIITPNEDIGQFIFKKYFKNTLVEYIDIFLRWHRDNLGEEKAVKNYSTITSSDFQKNILKIVEQEAEKSFDWWRQVGAVLIKGEDIVCVAHNEHMSEEQSPNIVGDPRSLFKRGIHIEYSTAAHAETVAIAGAAKRGISTKGAELYMTDFPCPYCARLIAKSGIKKIFFMKGYAVLDGDSFLKEEGVEIVRIER